jgi:anti-sigma regulatory factor (Ser/Thr protein kinase)
MIETTRIEATLAGVSQFTAELEQRFMSLPLEARTLLVLALQELGVNIVNHAYAGQTGQILFTIEQSATDVRILVIDNGLNAFSLPSEIIPPDPLDLPEGGLGLFIIYQVFDEVAYDRLVAGNRWQLVKHLGSLS